MIYITVFQPSIPRMYIRQCEHIFHYIFCFIILPNTSQYFNRNPKNNVLNYG